LAPCDFFLFPKIKLKPKGRRFDTTEEIQAESQKVLDTPTENDFQEALQKRSRQWQEATTSRMMAADRPYGEFYDFYVSAEHFGYTLVY
jgi:hypothetical protein